MLRRHLSAILTAHSEKVLHHPLIRASWNQNQILSHLPSCHWTVHNTDIKDGPHLTKEWRYNLKRALEVNFWEPVPHAQPDFCKICWTIALRWRWTKFPSATFFFTKQTNNNFLERIIIFNVNYLKLNLPTRRPVSCLRQLSSNCNGHLSSLRSGLKRQFFFPRSLINPRASRNHENLKARPLLWF